MTTYVVKVGEKYCHFGSYSKVKLFDTPERATMYSKKHLAFTKLGYPYWYDYNVKIEPDQFYVVEIELSLVSEKRMEKK